MRAERYFDNAATTRTDPRVIREMLPYFDAEYGNANSLHQWGRAAREAVELARQRLATLVGAEDPSEIAFTSGATEANNWVLRAFSGSISPFEHSSVRAAGCALEYTILANADWRLSEPDVETGLLSVMTVNNETGATLDLPPVPDGCLVHRDITQAVGKLPVDLADCDYASMSAHKFYGPKGVGALYAKGAAFPDPLLRGGEQEGGARSGTLNVPGIVGMGVAAALAEQEIGQRTARAAELRQTLVSLLSEIADCQVSEGPSQSPYILSISFQGVQGETLVIEADRMGYAISSGAACSSGSEEPSHVLKALGLEERIIRGSVRISFSNENSLEAVRGLARCLKECVEKLRKSKA